MGTSADTSATCAPRHSSLVQRNMMGSNKLVWFPDTKHGYAIGRIVDIGQTNVTVQPIAWPSASSLRYELVDEHSSSADLSQANIEFPYKSVFPCDQVDEQALRRNQGREPILNEADDSCALIQLHEAALLENVRIRFHRDKIYTYVAHILIAVNPYFEIKGLHSADAISRYQGKSLGTMPPHVYAIGESLRRRG